MAPFSGHGAVEGSPKVPPYLNHFATLPCVQELRKVTFFTRGAVLVIVKTDTHHHHCCDCQLVLLKKLDDDDDVSDTLVVCSLYALNHVGVISCRPKCLFVV